MPTILTVGPYQFRFYSSDYSEPPHIHAVRNRQRAKYWLSPVTLADGGRFKPHELSDIEKIVQEYESFFVEKWHEFFG